MNEARKIADENGRHALHDAGAWYRYGGFRGQSGRLPVASWRGWRVRGKNNEEIYLSMSWKGALEMLHKLKKVAALATILLCATVGRADIIVDNDSGPAQVQREGTWKVSTYWKGYYGTNYLHDGNTNKGAKSVTFRPHILTGGLYRVSLWWTPAKTYATNVSVSVIGALGMGGIFYINQRAGGREWTTMCEMPFAPGTNGYVQIQTAGTTNYVQADAVRFEWVGTYSQSPVYRIQVLPKPATNTKLLFEVPLVGSTEETIRSFGTNAFYRSSTVGAGPYVRWTNSTGPSTEFLWTPEEGVQP